MSDTSPADAHLDVDQALTARARTSADVLAGLIATGALHHAGRPDKLPTLMWSDADPDLVQDVWDAGLATGYYAGRLQASRYWHTDDLDAAREALREAGHTLLARTVEGAAYAAPSRPTPDNPPAGGGA